MPVIISHIDQPDPFSDCPDKYGQHQQHGDTGQDRTLC
jgi:hypothetical protein